MTWTRASVIKKTIKYSGQQKCYVKTKQQLHDATVFKQLKSENNGAGTQVETHSYSMKVFTFVIPMHPAWYLALVNPSKWMNDGHQVRDAQYM